MSEISTDIKILYSSLQPVTGYVPHPDFLVYQEDGFECLGKTARSPQGHCCKNPEKKFIPPVLWHYYRQILYSPAATLPSGENFTTVAEITLSPGKNPP
jgi:hypothetical protein